MTNFYDTDKAWADQIVCGDLYCFCTPAVSSPPVTQAIYLRKIRRNRQGRTFSHSYVFPWTCDFELQTFRMQNPWFLLKHCWFKGMVQLTLTRHTLWGSMMWFSEIPRFWNDLCRHKSENREKRVSPAIWSGNVNIHISYEFTFKLKCSLLLFKKYNEPL